jgi:hypothetical protein
MNIERATINDADEILHLQRLAFQVEADLYHDDHIQPLIQSLEEIQAEFDTYIFLKLV